MEHKNTVGDKWQLTRLCCWWRLMKTQDCWRLHDENKELWSGAKKKPLEWNFENKKNVPSSILSKFFWPFRVFSRSRMELEKKKSKKIKKKSKFYSWSSILSKKGQIHGTWQKISPIKKLTKKKNGTFKKKEWNLNKNIKTLNPFFWAILGENLSEVPF